MPDNNPLMQMKLTLLATFDSHHYVITIPGTDETHEVPAH